MTTQAIVNAMVRAVLWLKTASVDDVYSVSANEFTAPISRSTAGRC